MGLGFNGCRNVLFRDKIPMFICMTHLGLHVKQSQTDGGIGKSEKIIIGNEVNSDIWKSW